MLLETDTKDDYLWISVVVEHLLVAVDYMQVVGDRGLGCEPTQDANTLVHGSRMAEGIYDRCD
jgi:hypothetical protein